jgi:MFS family permease
MVAIRAILGAVEAVFFPGAIYYMSSWYNKQELGKRLGWLYIAQQVGNAFGGLFAAAVLKLDGVHGLNGWQWLFIIEGAATVAIGGAAAYVVSYSSEVRHTLTRFLQFFHAGISEYCPHVIAYPARYGCMEIGQGNRSESIAIPRHRTMTYETASPPRLLNLL